MLLHHHSGLNTQTSSQLHYSRLGERTDFFSAVFQPPRWPIFAPSVEGQGFKDYKIGPVASLVRIHYLRPRTGLVGLVSL